MKNTETVLRKVAEENGVSVVEVRREIQAIIDDLYNSDDSEKKKQVAFNNRNRSETYC